jgi:flagellar hook-associated protein 1 FlgK
MENAESNPGVLDESAGMPSDFTLFSVANEEDKLIYRVGENNPPGTVLTGLTIKNTQVNPKLIQDPTLFTFRTVEGNEDTATMTALKEAFTKEDYVLNPNVSTRNSFITYYNSLVSQVANSADVYNSIKEAQEKTVSAVDSAREQIVGVSSDEELEFMIMFQNAYNASSRYINVVSEMLEHLVTTLGS